MSPQSTIREVIEVQQKRLNSADARERAAALLRCGEVAARLQGLTDRQIGQLMFDMGWDKLPLTSPEMSITVEATERLFRSSAGGRADHEVFNEPGKLPSCPRCGNEMLRYVGINEPDYSRCVSLKCDYKTQERCVVEMTQVWARLYLGNRVDAEYLFKVNPHGISTAISLCEDKVLRPNPTINYIHLPIADATPISVGTFDAIMDAVAENIRWGTVLLHCGSGVSRAPIMTAAYMQTVGYKDIDGALAEIRKLRPIVGPSSILLKSVREHLR